ncbi:multidrug effflux MFS transporter [Pseudochrobactrum sp. MP213Fo]|uniref:multidrug effflux MFS transporter n=1 Tax=Pseudochrobactrum sp. MP213Fo TaxID=3022250 RepID=UPI003B9E6C0F
MKNEQASGKLPESGIASAAGFKLSKAEFIALMAALMAINALAIDVMLPALSEIGSSLGVLTANHHQYVISIYLLGFAVSQLFYGPISDRFGRKKPLLIGIGIYVATSLACVWVPDFNSLLALRFLQGIGAASTRVMAVSIVRDRYSGRAMAEIMSLAMMVFMIVPVIAPATGQIIMLFSEWHMIFGFMAFFACVIGFWAYMRLPETLAPENRRPFTAGSIISGFGIVLGNRTAFCYTMAASFMLGSLFGFINSAQQIYVGIYDLGKGFPIAFAGVAAFMALSAFLNSRMVGRYGMRRISQTLLITFISLSFLLLLLSAMLDGPVPFPIYIVIFALIMFCFGSIGGNFNALAMEPLGQVAGTASSVLGFVQSLTGAAIGTVIGQSFDGTTVPMSLGYFSVGAIAMVFVLVAEKGKLFRAVSPSPQHMIEK